MSRTSPTASGGLVTGLAVGMLTLLGLPVAVLVLGAWDVMGAGLGSPLVGPALWLSLETSLTSLGLTLLLGTPLAWKLARVERAQRTARVLETLVQLPMVIPPAVAGVALLMAFGRMGWPGSWLESMGLQVAFTSTAVVLAQTFVSAPFYVTAATTAFRGVDVRLLEAARGLGAGRIRTFWRVALPLALPGLLAGAAMCWARALGEFGATLMFAGNLPARTQTLPLAIYTALERDLDTARALSVLLVGVAFVVLLGVRAAWRRRRAA